MTDQEQSTGILGGLYLLSAAAVYAQWTTHVLPQGGPDLSGGFLWFPTLYPTANAPRQIVDSFCILLLCCQFMATWELLRSRVERGLTIFLVLGNLMIAGAVSMGAPLFGESAATTVRGLALTRMEIAYAFQAVSGFTPFGVFLVRRLLPDPTPLPRARVLWALRTSVFRWLGGLLLAAPFLLLANTHPLYLSAKAEYLPWRLAITYFFSAFLFLGLPYVFVTNLFRGMRRSEDRYDPCLLVLLVLRLVAKALLGQGRSLRLLRNTTLLGACRDLLVKLIFLPLVIGMLVGNFGGFLSEFSNLQRAWGAGSSGKVLFGAFYQFAFYGIIMMDTGLASLGYALSSRWLGNKSRSVDATLRGWTVTLACYPPLSGLATQIFPFHEPTPSGDGIDVALRCVILALFAVYLWATMSFGLRFSNLTNRGILKRGPYSFVRHPSYVCKNLIWWLERIRNFESIGLAVSLIIWNYLYYLRARTEEEHLSKDPEYQEYCRKVPYRFIPGVW